MNEILQVAALAGQIILENGGETYRVEETIWRICKLFGATEAESFVTPTGIMCSIIHNGETYSLIRRISTRSVDLDKIDKVNNLCRNISTRNLSVSDFREELLIINSSPRYSVPITIFFTALGASSFTLLFGGTIKDVFASFIIGIVIKIIGTKGSELGINSFFINSLSGAIVALLAILLVSIGIGDGINETIIGGIMLLVPGLAITNAVRDTISGDLVSGLTRGAEAFLIAVSIAVGTGAVISFWISNFGGI